MGMIAVKPRGLARSASYDMVTVRAKSVSRFLRGRRVRPQSAEKGQYQDRVAYLFQRPRRSYSCLMPSAEDEHTIGLASDDPIQNVADENVYVR